MKRRTFLKQLPVMAAAPVLLNHLPIQAMARHGILQHMASQSNNDRVMVIIQLHGGNDGLNTIIPVNQYAQYYHLRPNIAIADRGKRKFITLDSTLPDAAQAGLHPDMAGLKTLYDQGKVNIIQGVAYENLNQSHFRSQDIWFMGGGYDEYLGSGWMGRYLDQLYPAYPDAYPNAEMPDPLGLEIGSSVSLAFHRANGIPAGVSIDNPEQFYDLINSVGGEPPAEVADSFYGHELQWIMDIEKKSDQYAGRLREIYRKGSNSPHVAYPELYPFNAPPNALRSGIGAQLRMIARLMSGGAKTKIYIARIGGFDTHASQVESYDASMGIHASLLYHLSESLRAFQEDIKGLGLEDRVLTVTMSEFGRRAASNGSWGTDHGTAAPMIVVGKHVNPGVIGKSPDLSSLSHNNIAVQHDYRQVFGAIMQDWMQSSPATMQHVRFSPFVEEEHKLPIIRDVVMGSESAAFIANRFQLYDCVPNPVKGLVQFKYRVNTNIHVSLALYNMQGETIAKIVNKVHQAGQHFAEYDLSSLPAGIYVYMLKAGGFQQEKKLIKV